MASNASGNLGFPMAGPDALPERVRPDFPILSRTVRGGKPLIYLDSAATSQRPEQVVQAMADFTRTSNAAVHRGAHQLAEESTEAFEQARGTVAQFLKCAADEVVFTAGATFALNLVATAIGHASQGFGGAAAQRFALGRGDEIVVTEAEHHSNLLPWQQLAARTGAELKWLGLHDDGRVDISNLDEVITPRTKLVSITHISNVTGAITPVEPIIVAARAVGAITLLDACQSAAHLPLDLPELGVDFAALSGHKVFGPTGVGVLYGKSEALQALPPASFGGSMVETVSMAGATFAPPPARFEAGTQMITEAVGLAAALSWLESLGWSEIQQHERLMAAELLKISDIPGVSVVGPIDLHQRLALVSFKVEGVHSHDVGQVLDDQGVAVRVGLHCAQPVHTRLGLRASVRASASVYNTVAEIAAFRAALAKVRPFFGLD